MTIQKFPTEWAAEAGLVIVDPDGWRFPPKPFCIPITHAEYIERRASCTVGPIASAMGRAYLERQLEIINEVAPGALTPERAAELLALAEAQ